MSARAALVKRSPRDTRLIDTLKQRFPSLGSLAQGKPPPAQGPDHQAAAVGLDAAQGTPGTLCVSPIYLETPGVRVVEPVTITCDPANSDLYRALALYMGSSFAQYHVAMALAQGKRSSRVSADALHDLPVPFDLGNPASLKPWAALYEQWSVSCEGAERGDDTGAAPSAGQAPAKELEALVREVDELTYTALKLRLSQRWLVEDFVQVTRPALINGKVGAEAMRAPTEAELYAYAEALRDTLDYFIDRGEQYRHMVRITTEAQSGAVEIDFVTQPQPHPIVVASASAEAASTLRLAREGFGLLHGKGPACSRLQYCNAGVMIFKPMRRRWWTRSRALADADRIIADLIAKGGKEMSERQAAVAPAALAPAVPAAPTTSFMLAPSRHSLSHRNRPTPPPFFSGFRSRHEASMSDINHPNRIKARLEARPTQAAIIMALGANVNTGATRSEDAPRVQWPRPGDFVLINCAIGPSAARAGWLISASTTKPEFHTRWVIEDLNGVVREWFNVMVHGVPLGNPYAVEQDERWAHPNHGELPLMDGRNLGLSVNSHDADGKPTACAVIMPPAE